MAKKSNAKIRRMQKRAAARGEEYTPPTTNEPQNDRTTTEKNEKRMLAAATKLRKELKTIDSSEEMRAKERRSAKRKAEAIASEEAGCSVEALREWYETQKPVTKNSKQEEGREHRSPCIVFVGQLSYETTREGLFKHIQTTLGNDFGVVSEKTVRIRLLTDPKTKKSRGMAFLETTEPKLLYALLKLHHTALDGRRINVERTAGGKRRSDNRKEKLTRYRNEQEQYVSRFVDGLMATHTESGDLRPDELDPGVMALCKRHSPATVDLALKKYIGSGGRDMDNPSAYFTHVIGRIATDPDWDHPPNNNKRMRVSENSQN